jgi:hypothetical protein
MTVKELIEELETFDPEKEVVFALIWPDYWKTELALTCKYVDNGFVTHSKYHDQYRTLDENSETDLDIRNEGGASEVVVISQYRR